VLQHENLQGQVFFLGGQQFGKAGLRIAEKIVEGQMAGFYLFSRVQSPLVLNFFKHYLHISQPHRMVRE